jgi:hypothetical protein
VHSTQGSRPNQHDVPAEHARRRVTTRAQRQTMRDVPSRSRGLTLVFDHRAHSPPGVQDLAVVVTNAEPVCMIGHSALFGSMMWSTARW